MFIQMSVTFLFCEINFDGSSPQDLYNLHHKGTASIKMREINPSHKKETSFTCSLVIN